MGDRSSVDCLTGRVSKANLVGIRFDGATLEPSKLVVGAVGLCCDGC